MGLFHRKRRDSATPLEDIAEDDVASSRGGFRGDPISRQEARVEADHEDDSAEEQLIDEERRREEY